MDQVLVSLAHIVLVEEANDHAWADFTIALQHEHQSMAPIGRMLDLLDPQNVSVGVLASH